MKDVIEEFKRLVSGLDPSLPGAGTELLLSVMDPMCAQDLRYCAIPHEFTAAVLKVLVPEMSPARAEERYDEFSRLAFVSPGPDGLSFHEEMRRYLFLQWLKPQNAPAFAACSARLAAYFALMADSAQGQLREIALHKTMFHRIGPNRRKDSQSSSPSVVRRMSSFDSASARAS
jgi:hypothetical protein